MAGLRGRRAQPRTDPVTEHDLGLKVVSRRLLWRMGYTTRLDVKLRGVRGPGRPDRADERSQRGAGPESFTDLDVLGLGLAGGSRLYSAIVDCKTSQARSTERMFWVRGVADFFASDDAYMVREAVVTEAARQLATRLGITALTSDDLGRRTRRGGDHHVRRHGNAGQPSSQPTPASAIAAAPVMTFPTSPDGTTMSA